MGEEMCPKGCLCELTELTKLPIHSLLMQVLKRKPDLHQQPSYHQRNEVLDETDEERAPHRLGSQPLSAATCVITAYNIQSLMSSLPLSLQVLTLLQGPGLDNMTLEGSHLGQLESLEVLEIHGLAHGHQGVLCLMSDSLSSARQLRYLNLQDVRLVAAPTAGNSPRPLAGRTLPTANDDVDGDEDNGVQLLATGEEDVVPYRVYRERKELAALSAFAGLHRLLFLRALRCGIKEVHWEMFDGLQELEYLSLEGNEIPFLHDFAFYGTPSLKHLSLSHNRLLDVRSTGFAGLLNLEVLDLSYNEIFHLSEASLPPFPRMITADFHHNPIELILPNTFLIMNETKNLFISGKENGLLIRPYSFLGLSELRKLSLTDVRVTVLEREYFGGLNKLNELKIEGIVREISFDAFVEVPKLLELILKNCSIEKISMDAFFGLFGLLYLDLSHNELETIPPSLFSHQESLKEINLSNNKLTTLPGELFSDVPAKLIRLDNNPWHCTCMMSSWQPAQINKVKLRIIDSSKCQRRYDKGSGCQVSYMFQYSYDQSVSPRCTTPARYNGWSVFRLLRKHLRCQEKKYNLKPNKIKPKIHVVNLNSSAKLTKNNAVSDSSLQDRVISINKLEEEKLKSNSDGRGLKIIKPMSDILTLQNNTESTDETVHKHTTILQMQYTSPNQTNKDEHLWTLKDKAKNKALLEKENKLAKHLNTTVVQSNKLELPTNIDLQHKVKKKLDAQKKWQNKMENTIKQINGLT